MYHCESVTKVLHVPCICAIGDADGRSGRTAGDVIVRGLSVCSPSFPWDGKQPAVIRCVLCLFPSLFISRCWKLRNLDQGLCLEIKHLPSALGNKRVLVLFQVKFQVCTPQKSWSRSSPPSKTQPPRTDSPDRSTITSLTVSPVYLLAAPSVSLIISVCSHLCGMFVLVLSGKKKFLCTDYCVHLPAVYCIMCCKNTAVSVRLRLLPENQINSFIIVKVNPLKCSMLTISIQIFQGVTGLKISGDTKPSSRVDLPGVFFLLALCHWLFVLTPLC